MTRCPRCGLDISPNLYVTEKMSYMLSYTPDDGTSFLFESIIDGTESCAVMECPSCLHMLGEWSEYDELELTDWVDYLMESLEDD